MIFENIKSNKSNHKILIQDVKEQKIPHAQLFYGNAKSGTLATALAYAKYIFCSNKKNTSACSMCANCNKINLLIHPDLHFIFPVSSPPKNPVSSNFIELWRELILESMYSELEDWQKKISNTNKKLIINKHEIDNINKTLQKKSYQGGYKIFIIWFAEKLNKEASNKLLKNLEEPPEKTIFLLISNEKEKLLDTILSRLRVLKFNSIINAGLIKLKDENNYSENFVTWMRLCFYIIKRKKIKELVDWIDLFSKTPRDYQINFLIYTIDNFRNAFLYNYNVQKDLSLVKCFNDFSFSNFCKFVHTNNVFEILKSLENAIYYLNRNANVKLILMDLSIDLSNYINNLKEQNES